MTASMEDSTFKVAVFDPVVPAAVANCFKAFGRMSESLTFSQVLLCLDAVVAHVRTVSVCECDGTCGRGMGGLRRVP